MFFDWKTSPGGSWLLIANTEDFVFIGFHNIVTNMVALVVG